MFPVVDTRNLAAVQAEVATIYGRLFPKADVETMARAFEWVDDCFSGRLPGYQANDARYHDLEHTLQGTLCLARLLAARHQAGTVPVLSARVFELAMLAILLHDTGYLKTVDDTEGTGAKYTVTHVARSGDFAASLLARKGHPPADIRAVQNMISCTGVNVDLPAIPFANDTERVAGYALSTSDLLAQMAADDYVDKLPELYEEFAEAAQFCEGKPIPAILFNNVDDLMRKTPLFWERFVLPKINNDFCGLYKFLNNPYPDGPNWYLQKVEANLARLKQQLAEADVG